MKQSMWTCGSGGLFDFLGGVRSEGWGKFTMYATELKWLVCITTQEKKIVISCRQDVEFIRQVQQAQQDLNDSAPPVE